MPSPFPVICLTCRHLVVRFFRVAIRIGYYPDCALRLPHGGRAQTKGRWSKRVKGNERWVKPTLVAEVSFSEWTPDGHIRHPTFRGMRKDKPAQQVRRETAIGSL